MTEAWLRGLMARGQQSGLSLVDSAVMASSLPSEMGPSHKHIADSLASVGCSTVGHMRQFLGEASQEDILQALLAASKAAPEGETVSTEDITSSLGDLTELVVSSKPQQAKPSLSQLFKLHVDHSKVVEQGPQPMSGAPAPWADTDLFPSESAKPDLASVLQSWSQTAAGKEDLGTGSGSKLDKLNVRALIDRANLGNLCPKAVPSDELLKKGRAAAKAGLTSLSPPTVPDASQHAIASWLIEFVHRSVADLLLWRASPFGVLSELYQVAAIGVDPDLQDKGGLMLGIRYLQEIREDMLANSRSNPLPLDVDAFAAELPALERVWFERHEAPLARAARAIAGQVPKRAQPMAASGTCCLWHAMSTCTQESCKRSHECSWCDGKDCKHDAGYLKFHLAKLNVPRVIVPKASQPGWGERSKVPTRRSRSRRRSPDRRGDRRHARAGSPRKEHDSRYQAGGRDRR